MFSHSWFSPKSLYLYTCCYIVVYLLVYTYLLYFAVAQVEQIIYSTESSLEEENEAIVKQVVATHNKAVHSNDDGTLRKFQSMPHVMRSFFQSDTSSSNSSDCCDSEGKPYKLYTLQCFITI